MKVIVLLAMVSGILPVRQFGRTWDCASDIGSHFYRNVAFSPDAVARASLPPLVLTVWELLGSD
jgi:hypothetical protein